MIDVVYLSVFSIVKLAVATWLFSRTLPHREGFPACYARREIPLDLPYIGHLRQPGDVDRSFGELPGCRKHDLACRIPQRVGDHMHRHLPGLLEIHGYHLQRKRGRSADSIPEDAINPNDPGLKR